MPRIKVDVERIFAQSDSTDLVCLEDGSFVLLVQDEEGEQYLPSSESHRFSDWRDLVQFATQVLLSDHPALAEARQQLISTEKFGIVRNWLVEVDVKPLMSRKNLRLQLTQRHPGRLPNLSSLLIPSVLDTTLSFTLRVEDQPALMPFFYRGESPAISPVQLTFLACAVLAHPRTETASPDQFAPFFREIYEHPSWKTGGKGAAISPLPAETGSPTPSTPSPEERELPPLVTTNFRSGSQNWQETARRELGELLEAHGLPAPH